MATLIVIGYTAGGGLVMCAASLVLFECAVRCRSTFIAPRCSARPPETIYNPNPIHDCQKRGWPIFGWIGWVNSLSYETLLQGVPGTGTRKGGLEGIMLKVNMDGIVLLRFQYLCLKVCALISVLCIGIILPMNLTARCGYQHSSKAFSACFDPALTNLTDYQVTTLANIPELKASENAMSMIHFESWISARLYVVVLCTWVIYFVACVYMNLEWKTLLALRRVYYLEKDHWEERRRELEESLLRSREDIEGNKVMSNRDPWIPVSHMLPS
jgi:Late exocytosis, associated with Golgi transport